MIKGKLDVEMKTRLIIFLHILKHNTNDRIIQLEILFLKFNELHEKFCINSLERFSYLY